MRVSVIEGSRFARMSAAVEDVRGRLYRSCRTGVFIYVEYVRVRSSGRRELNTSVAMYFMDLVSTC